MNTGTESEDILIVFAVAAVADDFGSLPAVFDVGFGDIEENDGFDGVAGGGGGIDDGVFFAGPAANG